MCVFTGQTVVAGEETEATTPTAAAALMTHIDSPLSVHCLPMASAAATGGSRRLWLTLALLKGLHRQCHTACLTSLFMSLKRVT